MKLAFCITAAAWLGCATGAERAQRLKDLHFPDGYAFLAEEPISGEKVEAMAAVARDIESRPAPGEDQVTRCMRSLQSREFRVIRQGDVVFVHVDWKEGACGSAAEFVDSGRVYAVHNGQIIDKRADTGAPR